MDRTVGADETASYAIIRTVSTVEQRPMTDLPPLYETLDVDALDNLARSETDDPPQFEGSVTFEYSDSDVTVKVDGSVTVSATVRE